MDESRTASTPASSLKRPLDDDTVTTIVDDEPAAKKMKTDDAPTATAAAALSAAAASVAPSPASPAASAAVDVDSDVEITGYVTTATLTREVESRRASDSYPWPLPLGADLNAMVPTAQLYYADRMRAEAENSFVDGWHYHNQPWENWRARRMYDAVLGDISPSSILGPKSFLPLKRKCVSFEPIPPQCEPPGYSTTRLAAFHHRRSSKNPKKEITTEDAPTADAFTSSICTFDESRRRR